MKKKTVKIDLGMTKRVKDDLFCVLVPFDLQKIRRYMKIGISGGTTISFTWGIKGKNFVYAFVQQEITNCSLKNIDEKMESLIKKLYTYSKSKKISSDIECEIKDAFNVDTNVKVVGSLPKEKIQNIVNNLIKEQQRYDQDHQVHKEHTSILGYL